MLNLTRRAALKRLGLTVVLSGWSRFALAGDVRQRSRLVLVILRGGLDGLSAFPPYGDPNYSRARGALALQEETDLIKLDAFFGLHPALSPLRTFYERGELLIFPAVATTNRERSHASALTALYHGGGDNTRGCWLDRAIFELAMTSGWQPFGWLPKKNSIFFNEEPPSESVDLIADLCLGNPLLDPSLFGSKPASLDETDLSGACVADGSRREAVVFKARAEKVGRLLAELDGPRAAVLQLAGFDTHVRQGTVHGRLAQTLSGLADGLTALAQGCGAAWRDTVVMVTTEFGRAVAPNGHLGTDHGTASAALLLGGGVAGGRVIGPWPGLAPPDLYEGIDLSPTTDFRAIAKSVLISHMLLSPSLVNDVVFPDSASVAPIADVVRV